MDPRFSIIIPHYNIPDLLMRCLQSIPVSEDVQVIVVDDHSPDAATYLDRYPELSRPYLEFVRAPKNGGAGYARNIGIHHAKGKWLLFADPDDFFVDDMYAIISRYAGSDADVIYFKKKAVLSDDVNCPTSRDEYIDSIMDDYLKTGVELPLRTQYVVPWGKMMKKSLIEQHDIRFDEIRYSEDMLFSTQVGFYAKKIAAIDTILYVVTSREGSAIANYCSKPDELRTRADAAFRSDCFLLQHNVSHERLIVPFLQRMLRKDRKLFVDYFPKLNEIFPTKIAALKEIGKGCSLQFKAFLYLYSLLVWIRH